MGTVTNFLQSRTTHASRPRAPHPATRPPPRPPLGGARTARHAAGLAARAACEEAELATHATAVATPSVAMVSLGCPKNTVDSARRPLSAMRTKHVLGCAPTLF
jgi:hypothetical protein